MTAAFKSTLAVLLGAAVVAATCSFCLFSENRPMPESSPVIPVILWSNIPAFLASIIASGNPHHPSAAAFTVASFIQWAALFSIVVYLTARRKRKKAKSAERRGL
jgi:hypothetical protein